MQTPPKRHRFPGVAHGNPEHVFGLGLGVGFGSGPEPEQSQTLLRHTPPSKHLLPSTKHRLPQVEKRRFSRKTRPLILPTIRRKTTSRGKLFENDAMVLFK